MNDKNLSKLHHLLLEGFPDGIMITDPDGTILFVNKQAETIRRIDRQKLIGHNMMNCHAKSTQENVARAMDYLRSKPNASYLRMIEDKRNDKYYLNSYNSLFDEEGRYQGMAIITTDITEKRRNELQQANLAKMQEETLQSMQLQYHNLFIASLESLSCMLDAKDPYTKNHSRRVSEISMKLYDHLFGLNSEYLDIKTASTLHDIGKICIPDSVLNKPGPLDASEFDVIKKHPVIASDIVTPLDSGNRISSIIRHHHEHYDGTGYPDGLSGDQIPLGARIIAVADAYDAMCSDRPYRDAINPTVSIREIEKKAGTQFDPVLVQAFSELTATGSL